MATPQPINSRPISSLDVSQSTANDPNSSKSHHDSPRMRARPTIPLEPWQLKNSAAAANYEVVLNEQSRAGHQKNQQRIATIIANKREKYYQANSKASSTEFRKYIEESIESILNESQFDTSPYVSKVTNPTDGNFIHGYGKYLLYGEDNHGAPFCFQYFHFAPGHKTPLHDHPVPCISLVVRGQLVERHYSAISTTEARKTEITYRGYHNKQSIIDISLPNIHSLKNKHSEISGSVHFYHMDGDVSSRAVKTIYQKAPQNEQPIIRNMQQ
jgi:predicted metal-dependent enzyme (double-stranded beta helix superfamily)